MSESFLARSLRLAFAAPNYLAMPAAGIDISTSGVKIAVLKEHLHGIELASYGEELLPAGAVRDGEVADVPAVAAAVARLAHAHNVRFAHVALSESKSFLFEVTAAGRNPREWKTSVEAHIDEYVPLPPAEVAFAVTPVSITATDATVMGVGYARRVVEASLAMLDEAGITARSIESETFSMARAIVSADSKETVLVIDIGKTTTKIMVVTGGIPRFATTFAIGGHALTLAVEKHFGVSEEEARRIKAEKGLVGGDPNDEYISAMLSTVSAIREEIAKRLSYWQERAVPGTAHEPVTRALLVGGNATVRGLSEYFETSLKLPVELGDVFTNLASRDVWMPPLDYMQSLAYATAIGLALRDYAH